MEQLIHDVIIVWILTAFAGFIVGASGEDEVATSLVFVNIIFSIVDLSASAVV